MPSIHLHDLSYAHSSATPILANANVDLDGAPSWVGLVGPNGVGKTTLLRLLAGHLPGSDGSLILQADAPAVFVPQGVDDLSEDVSTFAWRWDNLAQRLRRRLLLSVDDPSELEAKWPTLSPGQRKRWQVAAAFAQDPDVLLLDEPTNHLDVQARAYVVEVMADFRGLGVIVSHDRTVLDQLTDRTLRLRNGAVELHRGSYTPASQRWKAEAASQREQHDRARREVRRQRKILADVRRDRHSAEAGPRRERRLAGPSEPDAREAGRKFAQARAEGSLAKRVGQMNSRVARAEDQVEALDVRREHDREVGFRATASGRRNLLRFAADVAHAGGTILLRDVEVTLVRGEHVHVTGANGAGKTTLLRAVGAAIAATDERLAQLPQELDDPAGELTRLAELDPQQRGRVLGVVASLGVDPDRLLVSADPSPGEARKLALAHLLSEDASVLILDEPTNHLDLPSIERLQVALEDWTGGLLLVTHDDMLAAAVTTTTWQVADGHVQVRRRDAPRGLDGDGR